VSWLDRLGEWRPVAFVLGYIIGTVAFVPGSLLTLAAGALFGLTEGVALAFIGAVLGSSAAFLISRLAHRRVERWLARDERLAAINRVIAAQGRRVVFLLRLSPVFPYNLLNYLLGVSPVRFRDYLAASVGMLPGTVLYVYSGKVVGDVAALVRGASAPRGPAYYILLGVGLAATIAVAAIIARAARRELRRIPGGDRALS
jgi:uncharacterized membrane protein YdjX (TVP38/TMEM64 family)